MEKKIITAALTGNWGDKSTNPALPMNPKEIAEAAGIPCYVSMEERMGCGVGGCLGCVCQTKDKDGPHRTRVCLNGPVFDSREEDWDA